MLLIKFKFIYDRNSQQVCVEGIYLNITKISYDSPIVYIIVNGEKLKAFSLRQEQNKNTHSSHLY